MRLPISLHHLLHTGGTLSGRLDLLKSTQPGLGTDVSPLALTVQHTASDSLRIKIGNAEGKRWEVPAELFPPSPGLAAASPAVLSAMQPEECATMWPSIDSISDILLPYTQANPQMGHTNPSPH